MSSILIALGLSVAPALAQSIDQPLAIPSGAEAAIRPAPAASALSGLSTQQARAARTYRSEHLELRPESELHGGGSTVIHQGYGHPYRYGYSGFSYVIHDPVYAVPSWGIYQGAERLSVPEYLGTVGRVGQKADLQAKIERLDRRSSRWYTLGGLGIAAAVGGVVTQIVSSDPTVNYYSHYTTLGGAGAMVLGFVTGSFPSARSERLEYKPAEWLESQQVQTEIDDYNAALGTRLGLNPEQQLMLETAPAVQWRPRVQPTQGGVTLGVGARF